MKLFATLLLTTALSVGTAWAKDDKPADDPKFKTVCVDVQGKDGKAVIDPKTKQPKQNCTKVRVRQKHEGKSIDDAKPEPKKK
jgi:hypothetical protein